MSNKILINWALGLFAALVLTLLLNNLLVDKITNRVMDELKRSYTPGPYDPGFDPDKVNPNYFREPELSKVQVPTWQN